MVLLISIDGLRPDALGIGYTPTLDALARDGYRAENARTLMPCCTLPCHNSMLRGVPVERHGITSNVFQPLVRPVPSALDQAARFQLRCGAFYNWGPLRDLYEPESVLAGIYLQDSHREEGDVRVADFALSHLKDDGLDFAFVYFGHVDEQGHRTGWMSDEYLEAARNADRQVLRLREAFPEANLLVMSDHGGHDRTHGTEMEEDMRIVALAHGPSVPRKLDSGSASIEQAAATAIGLLGIAPVNEWASPFFAPV